MSSRELDHQFLLHAIALAERGCHQYKDGGPFGAVIVMQGKILGEGWNQVIRQHDPTAHAEVMAIRHACRTTGHFHLEGATLYSSCEPCPMCLAAAHWAHISRIVFASTREDAARVGFCDAALYEEFSKPFAARSLPIEHLPLSEADAVMNSWQQQPDHTLY